MRRCLPLFILMMLVEGASAQCCPPAGPPTTAPIESVTKVERRGPPDEIVQVVPGTMRMTTKITFVVDTSGSMDHSGRVNQAITFARNILGQPGDDLIVTLYAFKDGFTKWPGLPPDPKEVRFGPPPPKGWTEFPGVPQQEAAQKWLTERGASGGTNPIGAMTDALGQNMKDLTIVLISDGEFDGPSFLEAVEKAQQERIKKGLGRAVIFVIGTGADAGKTDHMVDVAKKNGGGLHVIRRPKTEDDEEEDAVGANPSPAKATPPPPPAPTPVGPPAPKRP